MTRHLSFHLAISFSKVPYHTKKVHLDANLALGELSSSFYILSITHFPRNIQSYTICSRNITMAQSLLFYIQTNKIYQSTLKKVIVQDDYIHLAVKKQ